MPRLKTVSGKELIKHFQKLGFEIEYGRGSHCKLVRYLGEHIGDNKQGITIPLHKELAKGTLKAIYNQMSQYLPKGELNKVFYHK